MRNSYLFILVILLFGCSRSIVSVPDNNVQSLASEYNVLGYYYLPKTILKIKIPIERNTLIEGLIAKPGNGPLATYLENEFGWKAPTLSGGKFSIGKKITFEPLTLPDKGKRYAIGYKNSKALNQSMDISFTKDGLIKSGEFAQESKAYEITKKTLDLVGTVIGAAAPLGFDGTIDSSGNGGKAREKRLVTSAIQLMKDRGDIMKRPTNSVNNIEIFKLHIAEIDKQLKAIKEELVGKVKKTVNNITIHFDPQKEFEEQVLLKLNPNAGVVSVPNDSWSHLSADIRTNDSKNIKTLLIKASVLIEPGNVRKPVNIDSGCNCPEAFLYYNIPAKYSLQLIYDGKPVHSYTKDPKSKGAEDYQIYFPQLGDIGSLSKDFTNAKVVYFEDIGALKSVNFEKSAGINAERIQGIYDGVDSIRSAIQSRTEKVEESPEEEVIEESTEQVIRLIIEKEDKKEGSN